MVQAQIVSSSSSPVKALTITGQEIDVPAEFVCPISQELMKYPLASRSGQNYERSAIVFWLKHGSRVCPLTKSPMTISDLVPNTYLQHKIASWKVVNEVLEKEAENPEPVVVATFSAPLDSSVKTPEPLINYKKEHSRRSLLKKVLSGQKVFCVDI